MSSIIEIIALCASIAQADLTPPPECIEHKAGAAVVVDGRSLDALTRVAFAEASNQGAAGIAAVVNTIINRTVSPQFPNTIIEVVSQKGAFEPVLRKGSWERLPAASDADHEVVRTIVELTMSGHLTDPSNGALFFQNPQIVAKREAAGTVSEGLTHFGGKTPVAIIKDHAFYAGNDASASPQARITLASATDAAPAAVPEPSPRPSWAVFGHDESINVFK